MEDYEALVRQLERQLDRSLTPEEKRLLRLGLPRSEPISLRRRAGDREPTDA